MAHNCNLDQLAQDSRCFLQCFSPEERDAIRIYLSILSLQALGGTDYREDLTALLEAAKEWQVLSEEQRDAMQLKMDVENATDNGATFDSDVDSLKAQALQTLTIGREHRKNVLLFLECAINALGAP